MGLTAAESAARLTWLKVPTPGRGYRCVMNALSAKPLSASSSSAVAERLRAHARLCHHIAEQSWSEEAAGRLTRLADECERAAAEADPASRTR